MREQALQEQERRQAQEKAAREREKPIASAMRVPLHSIAVDVPPQVLQVNRFARLVTQLLSVTAAGANEAGEPHEVPCDPEAEEPSQTVFK